MSSSPLAFAALVLTLTPTPAGGMRSQQLSPLEDRALKLPVIAPGEPCPTSTGRLDVAPHESHIFGAGSFWFGRGPIFVGLAWKDSADDRATFRLERVPRDANTYRAKTPWVGDASYSGPILIRGYGLTEPRRRLEFDVFGAGRMGTLHLTAPNAPSVGLWSFWPSSMWVPGPGCYAVQVDTLPGTDIIVFEVQ